MQHDWTHVERPGESHTALDGKKSSEELNAQISPRTDDEYNLPYHEDELQEH